MPRAYQRGDLARLCWWGSQQVAIRVNQLPFLVDVYAESLARLTSYAIRVLLNAIHSID